MTKARASTLLTLKWPAVAGTLGQILEEAARSRRVLASVPAGQGASLQAVSLSACNHEERPAPDGATEHGLAALNETSWRRSPFSGASHSRPSPLSEQSLSPPSPVQSIRLEAPPFISLTRQSSAAALHGQENGRTSGGRKSPNSRSSSSNSQPPPRRKSRPYQAAAAAEVEGQGGNLFGVLLDGKELLTPARIPVQVPTLPLAYAIAAEWEWQAGLKLKPYTMPLTKLAVTSIDQIPKDRDRIIASLLNFFHTDQVLIRHPEPSAGPDPGVLGASLWGASDVNAIKGTAFHQQQHKLCERQRDLLDPLVELMRSKFGIEAVPSFECVPPPQSDRALALLEKTLASLDDWHLAAVDFLASATRSVTIGLLLSKGLVGLEAAMAAARLEEDFQIESAGFVEGGHDIDLADLRAKLLAPTVFIKLLDM